ncbi:MAG: LysM peptidoglycan-binding domain-containing protein [Candidatus Borkfalkiaceae bacterium]|nr:LysM peptidoglycan-binding domain-containing protein [Christensenellaceae bacterium]
MKKLLYQFEQNFLLSDENLSAGCGCGEVGDSYIGEKGDKPDDENGLFYRVEEGDDLQRIALKFNCPPSIIIKDNSLLSAVKRGNLLYIEKGENPLYRISLSDDLNSLCLLSGKTAAELATLNKINYFYPWQLIRLD